MFYLFALISGLFFGAGMIISGMVNPAIVIAFLDFAGDWNPALAFVMGGAIMVFMPAYFLLIKPRQKPVLAEEFNIPENKNIDAPLIVGASLFGLGWGLAGICPGPAVTALSGGNSSILLFFVAMMTGLWLGGRFKKSC